MAEYGRIDIVEVGTSVGGGTVVSILVDESTNNQYLNITAKELWEKLQTSVVTFVVEVGAGAVAVPWITSAQHAVDDYTFSLYVDGNTATFLAHGDDVKPAVENNMH